ncbi:MAG: MipA/OmpV family protein [Bermanella sp.]
MKWNRFYLVTLKLSLVCALFFNSSFVHSSQDAWQFRAGLAPLSASLPWKGMEDQRVLAPYFKASMGQWSFGVENIVSYQYSLGKNVQVITGINFRDQGYKNEASVFRKSSSDPVFINYQRPNQEFAATVNIRWYLLSIEVNQDISNHSQSTSIKSSIDIPLYRHKNGMQFKGTASALWHSAAYVNYYFGITAKQEDLALGRSQYKGHDSVNHQFTLNAMIPINTRWQFVSIISRTELGGEVYASPLIDTRYEDRASIALSYLF